MRKFILFGVAILLATVLGEVADAQLLPNTPLSTRLPGVPDVKGGLVTRRPPAGEKLSGRLAEEDLDLSTQLPNTRTKLMVRRALVPERKVRRANPELKLATRLPDPNLELMVRLPNCRTPLSVQLPYVPDRLSLQVPMPKEE